MNPMRRAVAVSGSTPTPMVRRASGAIELPMVDPEDLDDDDAASPLAIPGIDGARPIAASAPTAVRWFRSIR